MCIAQHFRRNLVLTNSIWCILACAMQWQLSREQCTYFPPLVSVCLHLPQWHFHSLQNYARAFAALVSGFLWFASRTLLHGLRPSMCQFVASELEFVGFLFSSNGLSPQESKINTVREWHIPTSVTDIRNFLGICGLTNASYIINGVGPPNGFVETKKEV